MAFTPLNAFIAQKLGGTAYTALQAGKQKELWNTNRHGKYYAGTYGTSSTAVGTSAYICNQSGVTLAALAATTYTGLAVQNPTGSGVNLVIQKVRFVNSVISAALQTIGLMNGHGTYTPGDSLTPSANMLGASPTLQAVVTASATLANTQVLLRPLASTQIAAGSYYGGEDFDGEIIVPPGQYVGFCQVVGSATSSAFLGSISWEEVAQ